jgi:zinc transporter
MEQGDGLLFAYVLDGRGGGRELDWQGIRAWSPEDGVLWVHLDRTGEGAQSWVTDETGIDKATAETLLMAMATRPRVQRIGDGLLVVLRGINFNAGDSDDDMVGLHMWIDENRIITLRRRRLMAGGVIRDLLVDGKGPRNASDFLSEIAEQLLQPIVPVIGELDDAVDEVQTELLLTSTDKPLRQQLHKIRQKAIALRRYLAPQRDAMSRLQVETVDWLLDLDRAYLRESADRTLRFVEDLDSIRERASIAQDELNSRVNDQMNRTMYLLTVVATLLLPAGILTGLFGINVGGMPGIETEWAFIGVTLLIPALAFLEYLLLRWLRWI